MQAKEAFEKELNDLIFSNQIKQIEYQKLEKTIAETYYSGKVAGLMLAASIFQAYFKPLQPPPP